MDKLQDYLNYLHNVISCFNSSYRNFLDSQLAVLLIRRQCIKPAYHIGSYLQIFLTIDLSTTIRP